MLLRKFFGRNKKRPSGELDPEDIFLDSSNIPHFNRNQMEGNIEKTISRKAGIGFLAIAVLICLGLGVKLWAINIKDNAIYEKRSEQNRLRYAAIFADRGKIFDRNGLPLAVNENNSNEVLSFKKRKYENNFGLGNLIGFVKYPQKDSAGFYYQADVRGMDGVEKDFNEYLAGKNGLRIIEVDARNNVQTEGRYLAPEGGKDLKLSIDSSLSRTLYEFMSTTAKAQGFSGGAGLVMDVKTGELIVFSNFPGYNSQILTDGVDLETLQNYNNDERKPYLNRIINGLYTPGSIVKPFVAVGALNENIISPEKKILSTGSISIPNEYDQEKKSVFNDWKAHGLVDMRKAIAVSSNVYFFEVGGGYEDQIGLGILRLEKYLRLFGFGSSVENLFLNGEDGAIPSPKWKELNFPNDPVWRVGDTYNTSIGQYGVQVTAIQVARAMSAIANGGRLVEPTIVFQDGTEAIKSTQTGIPPEYFQIVREGMRQGVTEGIATGLNFPQVKIAAKTGTAEIGTKNKKFVNSWVTGFFPYEDPRYVFVIMMERGPRDNNIGALYVMKKFFEWLTVNAPKMLE